MGRPILSGREKKSPNYDGIAFSTFLLWRAHRTVDDRLREAGHLRRVKVVVAQEVLDRFQLVPLPFHVPEVLRHGLLQVEGELILMGAREEVQRVADPEQEVARSLDVGDLLAVHDFIQDAG